MEILWWTTGFTPQANRHFCLYWQHSSSGATSGYWAWLLPAGAPILNSHFKSTPIGGLRWPRPVQKWFYSFCNKWNNTDTPVRASCLSFIARSPCRHAAFGFYGMYSCRSDFWFCLVFALMYCLISLLMQCVGMYLCRPDFQSCLVFLHIALPFLFMQCVGMYLCRPEAGDESNCGRRTGLSNKEEVGMHLLMCVHSYYSRVFVCITCTLVKVVRCIWLYI